jgi:transcriptional regulator with PAS, ATPase and Fis domain
MKQKISQQIYDLNEEIAKRKKAEKDNEINRTYLMETIDEKSEAIKAVSVMLKEEINKKTQAESKLRLKESTLDSLLKTNYCDGVLILSSTGEVLKINKKLSEDWELPEEVIINDSEEQLLKYFSYKLIDEKLFRDKYKLCKNSNLELGTFELKDSRKVLITYHPLKQDTIVIGKILTFYFT